MASELAGLCKVRATLREPSSPEAARRQRKQMPGWKHNRTAGQGYGPQEVEPTRYRAQKRHPLQSVALGFGKT